MKKEEIEYLIPQESNYTNENQVIVLRSLEERIRKIYRKYDLKEIILPTFEYVETYKKSYKSFREEKIFKYTGRDGKDIVLCSDFTIPIAKYYTSYNDGKIAKYSCFGTIYRKEEKYMGRNSETYQTGIEIINESVEDGNTECLKILQETMNILNLKNLKLELGSAKLFNRIVELVGEENKELLIEILSKKNSSKMKEFINGNGFDEQLGKFLLRLPRLCGNIDMIENEITSVKDTVILKEITELKEIYESLDNKEEIIFDLSMCPNMEYYTCLMFKVYSLSSPEAIISGGRYDSLYKEFGKDVPAIGMGYYLNNIVKALEKEDK